MFNILSTISDSHPYLRDFILEDFSDWLWIVILPLIIVFVVTFYIGLERQNVGKAAGISAHVLVALSSCAIAIIQRLMFYSQSQQNIADPEGQRIIAQVVTGIGFIGAGVIMKDSNNIIHGITTAATIWFAALLGLVVGSGYLLIGGGLGLFVMAFMTVRDLKRGVNPFIPHPDSASQHLIDNKLVEDSDLSEADK
ncbi:MAG TPA: MgtC/SapB family protein [Acholeplasma sp.]|jgi:putative Mg2+ transporter-C (MgtC) family protein